MFSTSRGMSAVKVLATLAVLAPKVAAHIAMWDPAMYGWDPNNVNQQEPVNPLANMNFDQWWFHGYINQPPAAGVFMDLPAGGTYHGQVACNKAQTSYGINPQAIANEYACDSIGPLHTTDNFGTSKPTNVMGCGLAIAYESDVKKIQPEDFTVISANYECPWKKKVDFDIPADLPACPPGGCHCMWGWVHSPMSGSEQMYFIGYRCNVTGATNTVPLPKPKTANKCHFPSDTSNCTVGPKQPHYWLQNERNNNHQDYYDPPYYNGEYGFKNGAQTDLYAGVSSSGSGTANKPSTSPSSSTTATSTTTSPSVAAATTSPAATTTTASDPDKRPGSSPSPSPSVLAKTSPSPSVASLEPKPSTSTATSNDRCSRRKRALELLDDPKALLKHKKRAARRAANKRRRVQAEVMKRHEESRGILMPDLVV